MFICNATTCNAHNYSFLPLSAPCMACSPLLPVLLRQACPKLRPNRSSLSEWLLDMHA